MALREQDTLYIMHHLLSLVNQGVLQCCKCEICPPHGIVRGTAWYSLASRGLVVGGGVSGGVGSMVNCYDNSY